jgi:hypothetical protein
MNPLTVFSEGFFGLAHGYGHSVTGYRDPVPGLINHLFVIQMPSAVLNQSAEGVKRLGSEIQVDAIPKQLAPGQIQAERSKSEVSHERLPITYREKI